MNSTDAYLDRAARLQADPSLRPHGVANTYNNWGCRCDPCTTAYLAYRARLTTSRIERDFGPTDGAGHGTMTRYNSGCKCPECMDAARAWARERELAEVL